MKLIPKAIGPMLALFSANLSAHGGGMDAYGCHRDNSKGNYHCHQGKYDGREFDSQQAILEQFVALSAPMEDRLKMLKRLHGQKLILDDEYQRARDAILEGL